MTLPAPRLWFVALLSLALALAGCGDKAAQQAPGKAAGGEVLPGTISDAMINVDQSRVQAPVEPSRVTAKTADDFMGAEPSDSAAADDAAPAPAAPGNGQ